MSAQNKPAPAPGSLQHAAYRIGITVPTLYKLIYAGKLRTYYVGRRRLVSDQAIEDCVQLLEAETAERGQVGAP